jgi:hypothetical protein
VLQLALSAAEAEASRFVRLPLFHSKKSVDRSVEPFDFAFSVGIWRQEALD